MFSVPGFNGGMNPRLQHGRAGPAGTPVPTDREVRVDELDQRLKAWFEALTAEPVPARLLEHLDALESGSANAGG